MASAPHGLDVSSWQGDVDWASVKASGRSFAWTKATGGTDYLNPTLASNAQGIRDSGLQRGYYHFAFETTVDPFPGLGPEAEADWFCAQIEPFGFVVGDLVALDVEDPGVPYGLDLGDWVLRWLWRVEDRLGWKPLIYTNASYISAHHLARVDLAEYGLWLASWQATPPSPPAPWPVVAFWQFTENGHCPGVVGSCDLDVYNGTRESMLLYGMPADHATEPPATEPPAEALPVYDWQEPYRPQENDWDCSCESIEWCLFAYGREPDDDWIEQSMIASGVVDPDVGCLDASGAGLAQWLNTEYGEFGYVASNTASVTFDDVATEAALLLHPLALGGRGWYHWSGVRGYDAAADVLLLANPAPGWQNVGQTMSRFDWDRLGPWSLVRFTHPKAENPPETVSGPEPEPPTTPSYPGIGTGLQEMMAADQTSPAQASSVWIGDDPSDVECCYGKNGTLYVYLLTTGQGYRFKPS